MCLLKETPADFTHQSLFTGCESTTTYVKESGTKPFVAPEGGRLINNFIKLCR